MLKENPDKLFFSIGEVAEELQVAPSLLRFWEKEFPSIRPKTTNKKGNRLYTRKEVQSIREIYELVKVKGFTLTGAKEQLKLLKKEPGKNSEVDDVKTVLLRIKNELLEIRNKL